MRKPVKAYGGKGKSVIYEFADGTGVIKCGGKIGWRSTNPGNITTGTLSRSFGSIGNNGPFIIFPDFSTGKQAIFKLLRLPVYFDITLEKAITKYAPPSANDTEAYIAFVIGRTGYRRNDLVKTLNLEPLVDAIIDKEGYLNPANHGEIKAVDDVTMNNKYKWRTRKDIVVRKEHREREGVEFTWDNPPEGGHPGEAYGCRCWAEAFEYEECFEKANPWLLDPASQIQMITALTQGLSEWAIDREIRLYTAQGGATDLAKV